MQIPSRVKKRTTKARIMQSSVPHYSSLNLSNGFDTILCVRRTFFRTNYHAISFSFALTKHYIKSLLADNLLLHVSIDSEAHGESLST